MLVVRFHNIPLILTVPEDGNRESVQIPQSDIPGCLSADHQGYGRGGSAGSHGGRTQLPGRVSQSTVYGMLARVALNMAGYPVYEPGMYAKAKVCPER